MTHDETRSAGLGAGVILMGFIATIARR